MNLKRNAVKTEKGVQVASNFFQRWSDRSLASKDHAETDLEASKDTIVRTENSAAEDLDLALKRDAEVGADTNNGSVPHEVSAADSNSDLSNSPTDLIDEHIEEELTIDDADKVTFDSGVASFLKHGVDKSVKKAALAKLFHADEFNYISDMDDHTEDFSNIPKLDESIAKQLRGWVKAVLEEPEAELIADAELVEDTELIEDTVLVAESEILVETEILAVENETTAGNSTTLVDDICSDNNRHSNSNNDKNRLER